jgi:hypothetical protein
MRTYFNAVFIILTVCAASVVFADNQKETINIDGKWNITIQFIYGTDNHSVNLNQNGNLLSGTYKGGFKEGSLEGTLEENTVEFKAYLRYDTSRIIFRYKGIVKGDTMKGTVDYVPNILVKKFWTATFTAKRKN